MSRRDRLHRRDAVLWTGTFSATPAFTCAPTVSTAWYFSPLLAQAAIQTPHDFSPQPHRTTAPCTIGQRQESWSVAGRTLHRRAGHFFFCKRAAGARDGPAKRRRKEPARWAQRKVSARILSQPTSALGQSCMCSTRVLLQREVSGIPRTGCSSDEACEASESVIESGREVGRACRMGPVGARRSAAGLATTARSFDSRSGTWIETVFLISANNV